MASIHGDKCKSLVTSESAFRKFGYKNSEIRVLTATFFVYGNLLNLIMVLVKKYIHCAKVHESSAYPRGIIFQPRWRNQSLPIYKVGKSKEIASP